MLSQIIDINLDPMVDHRRIQRTPDRLLEVDKEV